MTATQSPQVGNHVSAGRPTAAQGLDRSSLLSSVEGLSTGRSRLPSLAASMRATANHSTFLTSVSGPLWGTHATLDNTLQELLANIKEFMEEVRLGFWPAPVEKLALLARFELTIKVLMQMLYKSINKKAKSSSADQQEHREPEHEEGTTER